MIGNPPATDGPFRNGDLEFQTRILPDVSRTFALTIPQLPGMLYPVVANAYLLCRLADTIEDDADLSAPEKRRFSEDFIGVLAGDVPPERFADELGPRLSARTLDSEKELVINTARVVRVTHGFNAVQRRALERCVRIMSRGMAEFQQNKTTGGLDDLAHLGRYCYHVAGVVGEMLTELFCDYSPRIAEHRQELLDLSVSFGQGLQMTNILKDVWEDHGRGACWLPRDVFDRHGVELARIEPARADPGFEAGLRELVGATRGHLRNALRYTLLLPAGEAGIRRFCLWALGLAVLTLRRIHARPGYRSGDEVKVSRASVRATVLVTRLGVGNDALLTWLFEVFTRALPDAAPDLVQPRAHRA